MKLRATALLVAGALIGLTGCRSELTGELGNFDFSYPADDQINNFNKPIAVGAKLEMTVKQTGAGGMVDLATATTDDPNVLAVDSFSGNKFILSGVGTGETKVRVSGMVPSGATEEDRVTMMARVPEVLKLSHTCSSDANAALFTDQDAVIAYDMQMANSQPVIGYGYIPVDVAPLDALTVDHTSHDQQWMHFHTSATVQNVTVSSTIDSASLTIQLVTTAQIDGATLHSANPPSVPINRTWDYHVLPTVAGKRVCQPIVTFTVTSETTAICDVSSVAVPTNTGDPKDNEFGWVRVSGKATGQCDFTVTYPDGNGGSGTTVSLHVPVG